MSAARPLPHNPEAEKSLIGLLMTSKAAWRALAERGFSADWFHLPASRTVFSALKRISSESNQLPSPELVITDLTRLGSLKVLGRSDGEGTAAVLEYLNWGTADGAADVGDEPLGHRHADFHIKAIHDAYVQRQAHPIAQELAIAALGPADEFPEALSRTIHDLTKLGTSKIESVVPAADMVHRSITAIEARIESGGIAGIPTGLEDFDRATGGLIPDLIVIGAETSRGKSVLSLQFAAAAAKAGKRTLIFSLEMNVEVVGERLLCVTSGIEMGKIRDPRGLADHDLKRLTWAASELAGAPLLVCDDADITIQEIRAIARAEHAKSPLGCVICDYIQLISSPKTDTETREREVSLIAAQMKKMSEEFKCPVLAATQLNDAGRTRESRAISHHAGICILIDEDGLNLQKNRHGQRGITLAYELNGALQKFVPKRAAA
ncbi:MAG: replicative DNA helicase [Verrucomicrobiales bacterium]